MAKTRTVRHHSPLPSFSLGALGRPLLLRRAALALAGAVFGYAAFAGAVAGVARDGDVMLALRVSPGDPGALARAADRALFSEQPDLQTASRLAVRSVAANPMNPHAIRVLGFLHDAQGDARGAGQLVRLSERLSRRERATQLWLIEERVAANDLAGVMRHYDIMLRTSRPSWAMLFPLLDGALSEPDIRAEFARYVSSSAPWLMPFLRESTRTTKNPENLADALLRAGGLPADADYRPIESALLSRLAAAGRFSEAARYFRSMPGAQPRILASAALDNASIDARYRPISWQFTQSPAIGASPGNGHRIMAYAGSGARGAVARKLLYLAPGRYSFASRQVITQPSSGSGANWSLDCAESTREQPIWRGSELAGQDEFRAVVDISGACPAYMLKLNLAGGSDQQGVTMEVSEVALNRTAGPA